MVVVAADLIDDNKGESGSRWVLLAESQDVFAHSKVRDTFLGFQQHLYAADK